MLHLQLPRANAPWLMLTSAERLRRANSRDSSPARGGLALGTSSFRASKPQRSTSSGRPDLFSGLPAYLEFEVRRSNLSLMLERATFAQHARHRRSRTGIGIGINASSCRACCKFLTLDVRTAHLDARITRTMRRRGSFKLEADTS